MTTEDSLPHNESAQQDLSQALASSVLGEESASILAEENREPDSTVPLAPKLDALGRAWGTGRRKSSVARVIVSRGGGRITINKRSMEDYMPRDTNRLQVRRVLQEAKMDGLVDVTCRVHGGGTSGQAGAISHGIARALVNLDPNNRPSLRAAGFLTRDSRVVERKKYGLRKARRAFQFSKR